METPLTLAPMGVDLILEEIKLVLDEPKVFVIDTLKMKLLGNACIIVTMFSLSSSESFKLA